MRIKNKEILSVIMTAVIMLSSPSTLSAEDMSGFVSHGSLKIELLDFSDKDRWEEMRKSGESDQQSKLVNEIMFLNDQSKALASLEWLNGIIKNGEETDYVYPYMYAIQLHRMKYISNNSEAEATARTMSYYSKLLLITDSVRCDDNGVGTNRLYNLSKTLSKVDEETQSLPYNIKLIAMNTALYLENKYKDRGKRRSICETGAGFMARAMQSKKTKQVESIAKEGNKYGHITGSKVISIVPDDDVEVFYISDKDWYKKRGEIRESFKKSLKQ